MSRRLRYPLNRIMPAKILVRSELGPKSNVTLIGISKAIVQIQRMTLAATREKQRIPWVRQWIDKMNGGP